MQEVSPEVSVSSRPSFPPLPPIGRLPLELSVIGYVLVLTGSALGAYNIGPVPIQWLASALAITVGCLVLLFHWRSSDLPGSKWMVAICVWALGVTTVQGIFQNHEILMPVVSTSSYPVFILLRFATLGAFMAFCYLIWHLLKEGKQEIVIKGVILIGTIAAALALHFYLSTIYGFSEFPRNRLGTGGTAQSTTFTYAFHRALGTFREPSHLAEWLIAPFFFSLYWYKKVLNFPAILIGTVILLSGSLTGILGGALGILTSLLFFNPFKKNHLAALARLVLTLTLASIGFSGLVVADLKEDPKLIQLIMLAPADIDTVISHGKEAWQTGIPRTYGPHSFPERSLHRAVGERVVPILSKGGLANSNRDYVYNYVASVPTPLFGQGLGNSNIIFSQFLKSSLVASFLSLYVNYLFSLGIFGLFLLGGCLATPLFLCWKTIKIAEPDQFFLLVPYIAFLFMFTVNSEEFPLMFGVCYTVLAFEALKGKRREEPASV